MGAFLGLLKKTKDKRHGKSPSEGRPRDDEAGKEYSKVGDVAGDDDYSNNELADAMDDDGGDAGDDEMEEEASAHGAAFESLAESIGIPHEKRARARAALKSFVRSCKGEGDE